MGDFDCSKPADGTPLLTCCQEPLELVKYRGVQVYAAPSQVYQFGGFRTPWGWYPAGQFFADQLLVMNQVLKRAIEFCNFLPFPDTFIERPFPSPRRYKRYNLVHTSPVYGLPGLLINDASQLIVESSQTIGVPSNWAESGYNRPDLYQWYIQVSKVELTFNLQTSICTNTLICVAANSTKMTREASIVHEILAPDFDIVFWRNRGGCGNTYATTSVDFTPGAC